MYTVISAARMSNGSLASEFVNDAAVPWNPPAAGRHVHVFLRFVDRRDGVAQRSIRRQIERHRDRRKLTLVGNGERLRRVFKVGESAQRHGTAGGRTGRARGTGPLG